MNTSDRHFSDQYRFSYIARKTKVLNFRTRISETDHFRNFPGQFSCWAFPLMPRFARILPIKSHKRLDPATTNVAFGDGRIDDCLEHEMRCVSPLRKTVQSLIIKCPKRRHVQQCNPPLHHRSHYLGSVGWGWSWRSGGQLVDPRRIVVAESRRYDRTRWRLQHWSLVFQVLEKTTTWNAR